MNNAIAPAKAQQPTTLVMARKDQELQLERVNDMGLSPQVASLVGARLTGTKLHLATDEQLETLWNKVIFMLGIKVQQHDYKTHIDEMFLISDWVVSRYYDRLTVEEVELAYDMACQRKLEIKELFSILSPKHVGIVLDAYMQYILGNKTINRIFSQQMLIEPKGLSEEEINKLMEVEFDRAMYEVGTGKFFYDTGNGLFDWLMNQGRIAIDEDTSDQYYHRASQALPQLLDREKKNLSQSDTGKIAQVGKLIEQLESRIIGRDHQIRIECHAKRLYLNDYLKSLQSTPQTDNVLRNADKPAP